MDESPTDEQAPQTRPPVSWTDPSAPAQPAGSARTRSRWAIATLGLAGALGAIAFVQDLSGMAIFDAAEAGTLTESAATTFDSQFANIGLAQTVAYIVAAIAYLAWLSRAVDVTPRLGGGTPSVTPRWAIGWWFIPFANLVKPYQIVADLYRRMAPVAGIGTGIVLTWWVLWIANNILSNAAGRIWLAADDVGGLRTGLQMYALSDLVDPICALLAIIVVLRIQNWADGRQARPAPAEAVQMPEIMAAPPSELTSP